MSEQAYKRQGWEGRAVCTSADGTARDPELSINILALASTPTLR